MTDAAKRELEIERKYTVQAGGEVPDLKPLGPLSEPRVDTLTAYYYDTDDFALLDNRAVLRRRSGGKDAGWHVKTRGDGDTRQEIRLPLEGERVPPALRAELAGILGERALFPVVRLTTIRTTTTILDDAGEPRIEFVSDTVDGEVLRSDVERRITWSEAEVELLDGTPQNTFAEVEKILFAAGLAPAQWTSKLAHVLEGVTAKPAATVDSPAADAIAAVLGKHYGRLQSLEPGVLINAHDAVHQARVALRRMRSILQVFRGVLDKPTAKHLRDELRWAGDRLGTARDAEVLIEEFHALLDDLPADALVGPARDRILTTLTAQHEDALGIVEETLASSRWDDLLSGLGTVIADPPTTSRGAKKAAKRLPELADGAVDRVRTRYEAALADPEEDERWHDVRKGAKAARYAYETLATLGSAEADAKRLEWKAVASTLGTLQDARILTEHLDAIAAAAEQAGEPLDTYRELRTRIAAQHDKALKTGRQLVADLLD